MTSRDFAFWLQGLFELGEITSLNEKQTELIKRHLNLVFAHDIDPSMGGKEQQEKLNAIHSGKPNSQFPDFNNNENALMRC